MRERGGDACSLRPIGVRPSHGRGAPGGAGSSDYRGLGRDGCPLWLCRSERVHGRVGIRTTIAWTTRCGELREFPRSPARRRDRDGTDSSDLATSTPPSVRHVLTFRAASEFPEDLDDLMTILRIALSRARSRAIILEALGWVSYSSLSPSSRPIRAEARGRDEVIEIWNVQPGEPDSCPRDSTHPARVCRRRVAKGRTAAGRRDAAMPRGEGRPWVAYDVDARAHQGCWMRSPWKAALSHWTTKRQRRLVLRRPRPTPRGRRPPPRPERLPKRSLARRLVLVAHLGAGVCMLHSRAACTRATDVRLDLAALVGGSTLDTGGPNDLHRHSGLLGISHNVGRSTEAFRRLAIPDREDDIAALYDKSSGSPRRPPQMARRS